MVCENVASHVSEELSLSHISVNRILTEKVQDPDYRHRGIIKCCLDKKFDVSASLVVGLLKNEIKAEYGQSWAIISQFPNNTEQLVEFENKVI